MASSTERDALLTRETERKLSFFEDLLGSQVLYDLDRDAVILIQATVVRLFSFGFLSVILVLFLSEIGLTQVFCSTFSFLVLLFLLSLFTIYLV